MAAEELLSIVGARIFRLRKERGWSRRELGERSGLSERFLAELEGGNANPSLRTLAEIAAALEVEATTFLEKPPEVVALLGLRGAGKSTVGQALAQRLSFPFVELDQRIAESAGLPLDQIWELHGEAYYRQLERESLARVLATHPRAVLATGGGIVTDPTTFEFLRARSLTVWLRARPEVHWDRVVAQGDRRPMANDPLAMDRLRRLHAGREGLYRQAHHVIDVSDLAVEQAVAAIAALVERPGERAAARRGVA
jgi:XRE family aerobic/anaerobic benzoate catabolism transcriptional regulator